MGWSLSLPGLSIGKGRGGFSIDTPGFSYSEYNRRGRDCAPDYGRYGGYNGFSRGGWGGDCGPRFPRGGGYCPPPMRGGGFCPPMGPGSIPRYMNGFGGGLGMGAIAATRSCQGMVAMDRNGIVASSRGGVVGQVGAQGEAVDRYGNFRGGGAPDGTILDEYNQPLGWVAPEGDVFNVYNQRIGVLNVPGGLRGEHAGAMANLAFAGELRSAAYN